MDYDREIKDAINESKESMRIANEALKAVSELQAKYKESIKLTNAFLKQCAKNGIKRVSIGENDRTLEVCRSWPFGFSGSIFSNSARKEGSPALWKTLNECNIGYSCGNGDQAQTGNTKLVNGIYAFKDGAWEKRNN